MTPSPQDDDVAADGLVELAASLLEAEASEPVFIAVDGRTHDAGLVRQVARAFVAGRLATACSPEARARGVDLLFEALAERLLAWGSLAVDTAGARDLLLSLEPEGDFEVLARHADGLRVRPLRSDDA